MLVKWIEEGTLDDPQGEFMVSKSASASAVVEADPWARKYSCRTAMVPAFFSTELTNKILLIGKSINFIRYVCKDEGWALPVAIKREGAYILFFCLCRLTSAPLRAGVLEHERAGGDR